MAIYGDKISSLALAASSNALAYLYRLDGKYKQAAPLYLTALQLRERYLKESDPKLASTINSSVILFLFDFEILLTCFCHLGLAILYRSQGKYKEAEPLYQRALIMRRKIYGEVHKEVAQSLNSIGCLKQDQGMYREAKEYLNMALEQRESLLGNSHPDVAMTLTCAFVRNGSLRILTTKTSCCFRNLGALYLCESNYPLATSAYHRALAIYKQAYGEEHPVRCSTTHTHTHTHTLIRASFGLILIIFFLSGCGSGTE